MVAAIFAKKQKKQQSSCRQLTEQYGLNRGVPDTFHVIMPEGLLKNEYQDPNEQHAKRMPHIPFADFIKNILKQM